MLRRCIPRWPTSPRVLLSDTVGANFLLSIGGTVQTAAAWTVPTNVGIGAALLSEDLSGHRYAPGADHSGRHYSQLAVYSGHRSILRRRRIQLAIGSRPSGRTGNVGLGRHVAERLAIGIAALDGGRRSHCRRPTRVANRWGALSGGGNLTLNDPTYGNFGLGTFYSVVRTGTGSLELLAGGSFSEATPYGVYTAGTQAAPVLVNGSNPYDLIGALRSNITHAWYPEHSGDLLLVAQQDVTGYIETAPVQNTLRNTNTDRIANWLQTQGGGGLTPRSDRMVDQFRHLRQDRRGCNRRLPRRLPGDRHARWRQSDRDRRPQCRRNRRRRRNHLDRARSCGRVERAGAAGRDGAADRRRRSDAERRRHSQSDEPAHRVEIYWPDYFGSVADLRGNTIVRAGSVGAVLPNGRGGGASSVDPRTLDPSTFKDSIGRRSARHSRRATAASASRRAVTS